MGIKHDKVSSVPDGVSPAKVQSSDWNADHVIDDPAAVRADLELGDLATQDSVADADIAFTDVTTGNSAAGQHGFLKKLSTDPDEYMDGSGNWSVPPGTGAGTVDDSDVNFTDITTGNSATGQHGYLKKLSGTSTEYMDGSGAWSTPAGSGGAPALGTFPSISGLQMRVSAELSMMTLNTDDRVAQLNDMSGNWGSHFAATTTGRPRWRRNAIAGIRPGIIFDGGSNRLVAGSNRTLNQPCTVVTVFQHWRGGGGNSDMYRDSGGGPVFYRSSGTQWNAYAGAAINSSALYLQNTEGERPTDGAPAVSIQVYNNASSLISNNGVEVTGTLSTLGFSLLLGIGGNNSGTFAIFVLYEMCIFDSALGSSDRAALNTYYADALQIRL